MKKAILLLLLAMMIFSLFACAQPANQAEPDPEPYNPVGEPVEITGTSGNAGTDLPLVNWWTVQNFGQGFNTLLIELSNPNEYAIDFELDVTHLLRGSVVGHSNGLHYTALAPGAKGLIWYNYEIPETDSIEAEISYIMQSDYIPRSYTLAEEEKKGTGVKLSYDVDGSFTEATTFVVFYQDDVPTGCSLFSFYDEAESEYFYECLNSFNSYKIYANIY